MISLGHEIDAVTPDMLVALLRNMEKGVQACLDANDDHFAVMSANRTPHFPHTKLYP